MEANLITGNNIGAHKGAYLPAPSHSKVAENKVQPVPKSSGADISSGQDRKKGSEVEVKITSSIKDINLPVEKTFSIYKDPVSGQVVTRYRDIDGTVTFDPPPKLLAKFKGLTGDNSGKFFETEV